MCGLAVCVVLGVLSRLAEAASVVEVQLGDTAELQCPSNDDNHRFQFWQLVRENKYIGPTNPYNRNKYRYEVLTGTLTIRGVSSKEHGQYVCVCKHITNESYYSETVELVVKRDWQEVYENDPYNEDDIVVEASTQRDIIINEGRDTSSPLSTTSTPSTSSSATPVIPGKRLPSKKRVLELSTEVLSLIKEKFSKPQDKPCRFDILGKNWAEKLKVLPDEQRIFAEKLVNDVLFEAELGTLNRHCSISFPAPYQSAQQPTQNVSFWQA